MRYVDVHSKLSFETPFRKDPMGWQIPFGNRQNIREVPLPCGEAEAFHAMPRLRFGAKAQR